MYILTTMDKSAHPISDEKAKQYGEAMRNGQSFGITLETKYGNVFIPSHQICGIIPIEIFKHQNLLSMREKGQMICGHCKNIRSMHLKNCPHCSDNWEVANQIKKKKTFVEFGDLQQLYGFEENKKLQTNF